MIFASGYISFSLSRAMSMLSGSVMTGRKIRLHCLAALSASLLYRSIAFDPLASLTVLWQIIGAM